MRNAQTTMAGPPRYAGPAAHDRPLLLSLWTDSGIAGAFTLEWLLDRLDQQEKTI
ncbi:hypothetical protein [Thalassovita taeanensis]|uniref:Uncharacterized protein n=1 Tax=Thalassovita taeanensis TaxID=657014 RepID=A0A1H8YRP2_9RHOB|nr:hypothetical protein [Thalassovita taeanensis]SEP54836.1 hypothetical protein SAMN04488092_1018 [Thalassovita taeanensis]